MAYTLTDLRNIDQAYKEANPWESEHIKPFKAWIKRQKREIQGESCCYCLRDTTDEFSLSLDLEHILPKSKFEKNIFDFSNIAVACKRCNMRIKQARLDFLNLNLDEYRLKWSYKIYKSKNYKFIHPTLDNTYEHIHIEEQRKNEKKLRLYFPLTEKGEFTYKYFQLELLQIHQIEKLQGIASPSPDSDITSIVTSIFKKHGLF